jgi:hypothetical protein
MIDRRIVEQAEGVVAARGSRRSGNPGDAVKCDFFLRCGGGGHHSADFGGVEQTADVPAREVAPGAIQPRSGSRR